jgi:hypothetical protein
MFLLKLRGMAWFSGQPARAAASGGKRRRKR